MKRNFLFPLALFVSAAAALAQAPSVPFAINALRAKQKEVRWDEKTIVSADVTCDGIPDALVVGYQPDRLWLGVVYGTKPGGTPKTETLPFAVGKATQDSFCAVPVHIETAPIDCAPEDETLPGCKPVKGCREFLLDDDRCDSFHFYWDSVHQRLTWWRR